MDPHGARADAATNNQAGADAQASLPAPDQDHRWRITKVSASYSDPSVSGRILVKSGNTILWDVDANAVTEDFDPPLDGVKGSGVSVTVPAAGAGVTGRANIAATYE